eukprot:1309851-Pyramimonas_sp.AAC.1
MRCAAAAAHNGPWHGPQAAESVLGRVGKLLPLPVVGVHGAEAAVHAVVVRHDGVLLLTARENAPSVGARAAVDLVPPAAMDGTRLLDVRGPQVPRRARGTTQQASATGVPGEPLVDHDVDWLP